MGLVEMPSNITHRNKESSQVLSSKEKPRVKYHWLKIWGPGLIVMLADTDAGCLITAAQSGIKWGYTMLLPQLLLIPILYMAQEMTVRLGIVTRKGHGELIRENFGTGWAWLSAGTLAVSAIGVEVMNALLLPIVLGFLLVLEAKVLPKQYQMHGIYNVAPGPIWTPLIPSTFNEDQLKTWGKTTPMGRAGQPYEVAPAYLYLASGASQYVTGQTVHVNGGKIING